MPESVIDVWLGGNSGGSSGEFVSEIFSRSAQPGRRAELGDRIEILKMPT
jgi:hypothetical protein